MKERKEREFLVVTFHLKRKKRRKKRRSFESLRLKHSAAQINIENFYGEV